jgi:hypothetical protein
MQVATISISEICEKYAVKASSTHLKWAQYLTTNVNGEVILWQNRPYLSNGDWYCLHGNNKIVSRTAGAENLIFSIEK